MVGLECRQDAYSQRYKRGGEKYLLASLAVWKGLRLASCDKAGVESKKNHRESTGQLIFKNRSLSLFAMRFLPCQTRWTQILYIQSQRETGGHV